MKMRFTVDEIFRAAEWLESKGLYDKRKNEVFIERNSTGIGDTFIIKATTGDNEGIWSDLTDYDSW